MLYDRRYSCAESTVRRDVNGLRYLYACGQRRFLEGIEARLAAAPLTHAELIDLRAFLLDPRGLVAGEIGNVDAVVTATGAAGALGAIYDAAIDVMARRDLREITRLQKQWVARHARGEPEDAQGPPDADEFLRRLRAAVNQYGPLLRSERADRRRGPSVVRCERPWIVNRGRRTGRRKRWVPNAITCSAY